jgi:geranylgeranyl pyrophosphate synthase
VSEAATGASIEATLVERQRQLEEALREWAPTGEAAEVLEALRYSLFAPSKRLRAVLALFVADVLGGDARSVLPAACAIEMVHTASLIIDDLPCMHDARERRGRPACHVAFGEANALLAGCSLVGRAFEMLALGWPGGPLGTTRHELLQDLARALGPSGMIAGQARELAAKAGPLGFETLEFIHGRKTGALFVAAATLGARAAAAAPWAQRAVSSYARNLGLASQIVDELQAGSGGPAGPARTSFVSLAGVAGARRQVEQLISAGQDALQAFGAAAQPLRELARHVASRGR